jgi:hypothetical protein
LKTPSGPRELYRLGEALADRVIERHAQRLRGRARCVTIDLDPTDDPTHGAQQLSFFNRHYDSWCYLPVMGFVSFNGEAEQYLCAGRVASRQRDRHDGSAGDSASPDQYDFLQLSRGAGSVSIARFWESLAFQL